MSEILVDAFLAPFSSRLPRALSASAPTVTEADVLAVQAKWAGAIVKISEVHRAGGDYVATAAEAAGELYAYGHEDVLFKPTKARDVRFRPTAEQAMSYFVGASAVKDGIAEDGGFAINGAKGTYDFTCATTGDVATVEYTLGYQRCADGVVRIFLHHSSVPYAPHWGAPRARRRVRVGGEE